MNENLKNNNSEPENNEPQLTVEDMQAIFHILLQHGGGGIEIPVEVLENYPKKVDIRAEYDETNKIWRVFIPKKRVRTKKRPTIAVPRRQLILPDQF